MAGGAGTPSGSDHVPPANPNDPTQKEPLQPIPFSRMQILDRHNIWGLEKNRYMNTSWRFLLTVFMLCYFCCAVWIVKRFFCTEM